MTTSGRDIGGARCRGCGRGAPSTPPPLGWAFAVQGGVRVWYCEVCARENLRSIEARLDEP